jgi:hypothetical protein
MRLLQMLSVAAQAEGIVLRREMRGAVRQAIWVAVAFLFGTAAVVTAHVAAVAQLLPAYGMAAAAAIVAACDVVIAGLLLLLARRRVDPVAEEARVLRETMVSAVMRRDPMRDALGLAMRGGAAPLVGAVVADVFATWLKRR